MLLHNFLEFDLFLCKFRLPSQLVSGGGLEGDITWPVEAEKRKEREVIDQKIILSQALVFFFSIVMEEYRGLTTIR